MSFTRTSSGLKNYAKFYRVDITVFVEGRVENSVEKSETAKFAAQSQTSDELFHNTVLRTFSPAHKFKVKSVGAKTNVEAYAKKILSGDAQNCLLIYDSDYESVISSWVAPAWSMRTNGYSWENDLWNMKLSEDLIDLFAGGRNWNKTEFHRKYEQAAKRAERLGRIEVICRIHGLNLIIPNGKSIGISLDARCPSIITAREVSRLSAKIKQALGTADQREILAAKSLTGGLDYCSLIRGHLWEAICITLIVATLKSIDIQGALPANMIRNVALGLFKDRADYYLSQSAQLHYARQHRRAGL